jgi:hypothetical protein
MDKRAITGLAVAATLAAGALGATIAMAEGPTPPPTTSPAGSPGQNNDRQEPKLPGSIQVPTTADSAAEADEAAALAKLAKITADQAKQAALTRFPGATIGKIALEDENGSLVYAVELIDANKAAQEVKIDAGNGAVLAVEAGGADNEGKGKEADND